MVVPGTQFKQGTPHAMEIRYKFNNVQPAVAQQGSPQPSQQGANGAPPAGQRGGGRGASPEDVKAGHNMAELWSTFARTGHPAAQGRPEWPPYTAEKRATMQIDAKCEIVNDPSLLERQLWERLDP